MSGPEARSAFPAQELELRGWDDKPGILAESARGRRLGAPWPWLFPPFESKSVSRKQKLQKQVQSFLLETQHSAWESSTQRSSLLI